MVPWFFRDPERLKLERAGIEKLSQSVNWLIGTEWRINEDGLSLNAIIRVKGYDYEVRVSFPDLYPDAPSVVRPKNMTSRISTHQYGGADGPLCLEWGPDNWHRDVTAAQMLESTYRLLEIENPLGEDRPDIPVVAPSRHSLSIGQELRNKWARWYASDALSDYFKAQPKDSVGTFKFSFRKVGENRIGLVHEIQNSEENSWRDDHIPTTLPKAETGDQHTGIWFKTEWESKVIKRLSNLAELRGLLGTREEAKFLFTNGSSPIEGFGRYISGILIVDQEGVLHLFIVLSDEDVFECSRVWSDALPVQTRSPESNILLDKKIAIIGLGSVGSKIAVSLARIGCNKFYFVDHDLFLPENLQRHSLDWQAVAQHKVDAMMDAILLVAPGSKIDVSRLHITGQESNAAINGVLNNLAACDILIDATANARVFNLLAAVARTVGLPIVWIEVFGGGLGGLIARSRPKIDPTPQDMKGVYLQFCSAHPAPNLKPVLGNYAIENEEGEVLVASDADVAIIAHHAVRFITDCFNVPAQSIFPYSMYLIGLSKGWIFEAPFDTQPISMQSYSVDGWVNDKKPDLSDEDIQFLCNLLKKDNNAASNTP